MVAHCYNISTWEVEAEGTVQGHLWPHIRIVGNLGYMSPKIAF